MHLNPITLEKLPSDEVLAKARMLAIAALAGQIAKPLRGKHVGLLCQADDEAAALFREAAVELGVTVAQIKPGLSELSTPHEVQHTARTLGKLYDAVECQGLAATLVLVLGKESGIPIYDGLATQKRALAKLAAPLGVKAPAADRRRWVLQAALLCTIV